MAVLVSILAGVFADLRGRLYTYRQNVKEYSTPKQSAILPMFLPITQTRETLGVRYCINQRVAQEVPGHSDANLTAKVYTDVPALALHTEIAKLPWIEAKPAAEVAPAGQNRAVGELAAPAQAVTSDAHTHKETHRNPVIPAPASLAELCDQLVSSVSDTDHDSFSRVLSSLVTSRQKDDLAARAGIEPATK
jgi:hypothetical protein